VVAADWPSTAKHTRRQSHARKANRAWEMERQRVARPNGEAGWDEVRRNLTARRHYPFF